jgi:outer membrane protein OmpA-like peptidoglycan-associated protein
MNIHFGKLIRLSFLALIGLQLFTTVPAYAAASKQSAGGKKTKIQGVVLSRDGDIVKVQGQKSGVIKEVQITGATEIRRGRKKRDVSALVPGLRVTVKGVQNEEGQLQANKVQLKPDAFDITVAQQELILENKVAAAHAQAAADEGIAKAGAAQSSAEQARGIADQALSTAQTATAMASSNTTAIAEVNQRVSLVGEFATLAELPVYFSEGSYKLTKQSKAILDKFIAAHSDLDGNGYLIEITGYTSSTGSRQFNQTLSEKRAAAVAQYLRQQGNVPAWRITAPAGYGETHPAAENTDSTGRAQNRRVQVTVLVSKAVQQSAPVASAAVN